ncbi:hypothetical protein [Nonomuraea sp. NPDC003214]
MSNPDETTCAAPAPGAAAPAGPPVDRRMESLGYLLAKAGIKLLESAAAAHADTLRTSRRPDNSPLMDVADREAAWLAGRRLGATRMDPGKVTVQWDGSDPRAVEWVKAHPKYSSELREIVEPALVTKLKAHAKKVGGPVDENGDPIPGMWIDYGKPTPVQELVDDFAEVIAAAIESGELTLERLFPGLLTPPPTALEENPPS